MRATCSAASPSLRSPSSTRTSSWSTTYLAEANRVGAAIVAVFETHVQADHVSGLPALVESTGAAAYLPEGAGVDFEHFPLADGATVELGNTLVRALATPGHAPAHHAYVVADRRRGDEEPWLVFTGDSLLVGDVGRPDLHAAGQPEPLARQLHAVDRPAARAPGWRARLSEPLRRLGLRTRPLQQPVLLDRVRADHNEALAHADADSFARALLVDVPPPPAGQAEIVAANRARRIAVQA